MLQKRVVKWRNSAKNGHKRVCEWCGKEFAAKTVRTRFCSDRCSKTAYKHNKRLEFVSNFNLGASIRKKPDDGTAERYSLSLAGVYKILQENKVPSCKLRGKTYYSLSHVTRLFTKREKESFPEITEWYTCEEIMRKYGMTQSNVYCMINASGIPSKRIKKTSYYSKRHVDLLKQNDVPQSSDYYTVEECMSRYGYTRDQVYHYLRYYSIDRVRKGKFTLFLKSDFDRLFEKLEPG